MAKKTYVKAVETEGGKTKERALSVEELAKATGSIKMKVVDALPAVKDAEPLTIYLVPNGKTEGDNTHDEYVVSDGKWELIGSTAVDLSGFKKVKTFLTTFSQSTGGVISGFTTEIVNAIKYDDRTEVIAKSNTGGAEGFAVANYVGYIGYDAIALQGVIGMSRFEWLGEISGTSFVLKQKIS